MKYNVLRKLKIILTSALLFVILLLSIIIYSYKAPYWFAGKYSKKISPFIVYSNRPISDTAIKYFKNLKKKKIFEENFSYKIFLTDNKKNYSRITPRFYDSFAISKEISGNIIIAPSNLIKDEVRRNGKRNNIRKLSSVILHECTHRYLKKKYGFLKMIRVKTWKEEGYCEYIAQGSSFDISKGLKLFLQNKRDKSQSFDYFKYRLYVQYLIDYKKMKFDNILNTNFKITELESEIRKNIKNGSYIPFLN